MTSALQSPPLMQKTFIDSAETAGLTSGNELHGEGDKGGLKRPVSLSWITDELLHQTRQVWSQAYGRPIGKDEAIEMLINVKRLAEAMFKVYLKRR